MKREECSVDPDTFEEGLVLQLFKIYYYVIVIASLER